MHLRNVNYCTHDPRHHSSFIPVIVSGKEYPKETCLAPRLNFIIIRDKGGYCFILFYFIIIFYFIIKIFSFYFERMNFFFQILMHFQKDLKLRMHQMFDNYRFTFGKGLPF